MPPLGHRVAGIHHEIDEDLVELARIGLMCPVSGSRWSTSRTFSPISGCSIGSSASMRALRSRTHRLDDAPSPEGQQLRGQDGRAIGRLGDRLDAVQGGRPIELALGRGIQVLGEHLGVAR